jgi:hypothetical protein
VRAERLLAFLLGVGAVAGFAALMQRIVRDWRIVLLATFTFAFSGGIALHIGRLRSELLAAALALAALFILIAAARRATRSRPLLLGVAAFLCVAALTSKVHAILLIAAFPVLLLPFGSAESESVAPWRNFVTARAWLAGLAIVATASIFAAWPLIREGLDPQIVAAVPISRFLGLPYGIASTAIMIWLVAGSVVFAKVWRISAAETCTALLAIAVGAAIGLCVLWIDHHAYNAAAVINPLERMMSWAIDKQPEPAAGMLGAALLSDIVKALAHYTFVLAPSSRPTIFLAWLIVPAIVYAWRRGDRQIAMQALVLIAVAFALDMLGMRRGLKAEYWIFSDPLIILAGALLIEHYSRFRNLRFAFPVAVALFAAHIIVSQSASARTALLRRPPQPICEWNRLYLPAMPLHFCPQ